MDIRSIHLIHRTCFGDFDHFSDISESDLINKLCSPKQRLTVPVPFYKFPINKNSLSKKEKKELRKDLHQLTAQVNLYWINTMIDKRTNPLLEKMTLFWHGHFACESKRFDFAHNQLCIIRENALGDFKKLVLEIAKSASMILYLNNQQNRKNKPNENFARELMELFTLGRGNYTEKDVKEAARAFTGWFTNRQNGDFSFNPRQHDSGIKTFMGKKGNFTGEDIIEIILQQEKCASFICKKLYTYFVHPKPNEDHIGQMAQVFLNSDYNISSVMQFILKADWFYDEKNLGVQIKSPVELMVSLGRHCQFNYPSTRSILIIERILGQILFKPPNVAGWPGNKRWIDNATLIYRLNLASIIFKNKDQRIQPKEVAERKRLSPMKWDISLDLKRLLDSIEEKQLEMGFDMRFLVPLKNERYVKLTQQSDEQILNEFIQILSSIEYQMC